MKSSIYLSFACACLFGSFLLPVSVLASEITVRDCQGLPRTVYDLGDKHKADIKVDFSGEVISGVRSKVYLINSSGEKREASVKKGQVVFKDVAAGSWRVCAEDRSLMLADIRVLETGGLNSVIASLTGAGLIGGGAIIAGSSGGDSSTPVVVSAGASASTAVEPEVVAAAPEVVIENSSASDSSQFQNSDVVVSSRPKRKKNGPCLKPASQGGCRTDEEPTPISVFN
ncbi:MAG: hypothetical protein D6719_08305 [Candidatus Dadabacteria bacterium]|nr:MAG: hypothetical protein D6719_08305 [Candidatus Dadabacteria bacterium]